MGATPFRPLRSVVTTIPQAIVQLPAAKLIRRCKGPSALMHQIRQVPKIAAQGLEMPKKTPEKQGFSEKSGAASDATDASVAATAHPDLARVIASRPTLPTAIKR